MDSFWQQCPSEQILRAMATMSPICRSRGQEWNVIPSHFCFASKHRYCTLLLFEKNRLVAAAVENVSIPELITPEGAGHMM